MTKRSEFVAELVHDVDGWLLEAVTDHPTGRPLSVWLRGIRARVAVTVGQHYDQITQQQPAAPAATTQKER